MTTDAFANLQVIEFPRHYSSSIEIPARPDQIFSLLDDHKKIGSHMEKSSWMMAGSHMKFELDEKDGRAVGSEIILRGAMMGIPLFIREVVAERKPSVKKVWQTVGEQEMIILDQYGWVLKSHKKTTDRSSRFLSITASQKLQDEKFWDICSVRSMQDGVPSR